MEAWREELYHHGILGQRWGVRRYQNTDGSLTAAGRRRYDTGKRDDVNTITSAKGLQKRLNDVDQAMAYHKRQVADSQFVMNGYTRKALKRAEKLNKKGLSEKDDKKYNKYTEKVAKEAAKQLESKKMIQKGQEETERLLSQARLNSMKIDSKECLRDVTRGKDRALTAVSALAATAALAAGAPFAMTTIYSPKASGTKYKVKDSIDAMKDTLKQEQIVNNYNKSLRKNSKAAQKQRDKLETMKKADQERSDAAHLEWARNTRAKSLDNSYYGNTKKWDKEISKIEEEFKKKYGYVPKNTYRR